VKGVGDDAGVAELPGEVEGVHDLGERALAVRAHAAVAVLEHDVVEVDGHLAR
jgi:hypothetical protein